MNEENKNKQLSLLKIYKIYNIISYVLFGLLGLDFIGLVLGFIFIKEEVILLVFVCLLGLLAVILAVGGFLFVRLGKKVLYDELFLTTKENIALFTHRKKLFNPLKYKNLEESDELNEMFADISDHFSTLCLENGSLADTDINLEYEKGSRSVVSYDSLVDNIPLILHAAKFFRNGFIQLTYNLGGEMIKDKDAKQVIKSIKKCLNYPGLLISESKKKKGFLIYVPRVDSVSQLTEEVDRLLKGISLLRNTPHGHEMVLCHAAVVVYPYSDIDNILDDLKFAARQKKILNVYLPNSQLGKNPYLLESDMNQNHMSKFIERFASLKVEAKNLDASYVRIAKLIGQVADHFCFTCAGFIEFDNDSDSYVSKYSYSSTNSHIFPEGATINSDFMTNLNEVKDYDGSYYFSSRKHLNDSIAPFIDIYGIKSGQFFTLTVNEKNVAVLYFLNDDKELNLDTYLRECLSVFAHTLTAFLKSVRDTKYSLLNRTRFRDITRLSNIRLYSVAKNSHRLTFISDALMDEVPSAKKHRTCYKSIYGLSEPCPGCPIVSKRSLVQTLGKAKYETTIVLHNAEDDSIHMLMKPCEGTPVMDRFDQNILTNTYSSYLDNMNNAFQGGVKGYVLFLSLTNLAPLLEKDGNEGYSFILRNFTRSLRDTTGQMSLFLYKDNVLALILPSYDRFGIIDICEKIYDISKAAKNIDGSDFPLNLTYIACYFPLDYKSLVEFNNAMETLFPKFISDAEPDLLHFADDNVTRRASKTGYLLSVIDDSFNKATFKIKMQPVVDNISWRMAGAELLLRLRDDYRDIPLSAKEIIQVAAENNRIGTISDALLVYVGDLYARHGYSFFKSMGLTHISLNTDYSYFENSDFIEKLGNMTTKHSIPKGFVAMEISEGDVASHLEGYSSITAGILKTNTGLICDDFTGDSVSLQMLKDLGFSEIKISTSLVLHIGEDASYLNRVETIYHHAMLLGLKVTLVGIEDKTNYDLIKDECRECDIQGKYFYDPLEESAFLEALRKSNI